MIKITLNGNWILRPAGALKGSLLKPLKDNSIPAKVPGDVHNDLLNNKLIPDPFYRDNENDIQWIGYQAFVYQRDFKVTSAMLNEENIELQCAGLDTLATVKINNKTIAKTENMFREWCWSVKSSLKLGNNTIEIKFDPAVAHVENKDKSRVLPHWARDNAKQCAGTYGYIRKMACNFGWDWGVKLVTSGIWKDIDLCAYSTARIDSLIISQDHSKKGVQLNTKVNTLNNNKSSVSATATLKYNGKKISSSELKFNKSSAEILLDIEQPKLWWPNNMGDQPLYDLSVELFNSKGELLDTATRKVGLRTLELDCHKDEWGESFQFVVNGIPFFAKGGNWIPSDGILSRMTKGRYEQMVQDCADANMNMLRVWGGGIYESEDFYDACDRLGICVWQDFMVACSTFPSFDKEVVASFKQEAIDNVTRIHHRACMALWCGNNELEMGLVKDKWGDDAMAWKDYKKIFDTLLGDVVNSIAPQTAYWPCSPHTPVGDRNDFNNADSGDAHLWSVWHGKLPFEWYRTCGHRFNSEFGFQAFPEPKTVATYTNKDDQNVTTRIMEHHQRSGIGNSTIMTYMTDWFRLPVGFENTLWLSQILQGMAIKYACEHWRRSMPRGMGTLYWQINDTWQVASWSSIDYFGRWKALQFMSKKFFAPILVSALEDSDKGTVELHLTSDREKVVKGNLSWKITTIKGEMIEKGSKNCTSAINGNRLAHKLNLKKQIDQYKSHNLLIWTAFKAKGEESSNNVTFFARPKHMDLLNPGITKKITKNTNGTFKLELAAKYPSLWTWVEFEGIDASLSDNFVHLCPGEKTSITIKPFLDLNGKSSDLDLTQLKKSIKVKSLWDTYR